MSDLTFACFVTECVSCGQHKVVTYRTAQAIKDYRSSAKPITGYYCADCDPVAKQQRNAQRTLDWIYYATIGCLCMAVIVWLIAHIRITFLP